MSKFASIFQQSIFSIMNFKTTFLMASLCWASTAFAQVEANVPVKNDASRIPAECIHSSAKRNALKSPASPNRLPDFTKDDIISAAPEGVASNYVRTGECYSNTLWGAMQGSVSDMLGRMVKGDDGYVYLFEPLSGLATHSWIKGEENDGVITFSLPQAVYTDSDGVNEYVYTLQMAHYVRIDDESGRYEANTEGQTTDLVFRNIDGNWVMDSESMDDHPVIASLFDDENQWCIFSDWDMTYKPFDFKSADPPVGLETSSWAMTYSGDGRFVEIGFDGDKVWLQGIAGNPWIKGYVKDNTVEFPSDQLVGVDENDKIIFFFGVEEQEAYNEEWDFYYTVLVPNDAAVFDYDKENKIMTGRNSMVLNQGNETLDNYASLFTKPVIKVQGENISYQPQEPTGFYYVPYDEYYGHGTLYFAFFKTNADNDLLNPDNLYYRVYVDGELFSFEPDEYFDLEEPMTDVPYYYTNYNDISYYGAATHFFSFYFMGVEELGVQTVYKDGDKEYCSQIVDAVKATAIDSLNADKNVKSEVIYDLSGRQVINPDKGIFIKKVTCSDGTVKTVKIAR